MRTEELDWDMGSWLLGLRGVCVITMRWIAWLGIEGVAWWMV